MPAWLRALRARFGDREAVVGSSGRLSYRDLDEQSALLARGLLARGVTKGARVGLWLTNGPDWVVTWSAVSRIGAVAVPLSTFFTSREPPGSTSGCGQRRSTPTASSTPVTKARSTGGVYTSEAG